MSEFNYPTLLEPKPFVVELPDGSKAEYILSKFPAVAGREIIAKYPSSNIPKLGDYAVSNEIMLKLMHFVAIDQGNAGMLRLGTQTLVDQHVKSWEVLAKLEMAMMEYNCSFFRDGTAYVFLQNVVEMVLEKIGAMLIPSSPPSSPTEKPPSTS
jgi:hypothetical protein